MNIAKQNNPIVAAVLGLVFVGALVGIVMQVVKGQSMLSAQKAAASGASQTSAGSSEGATDSNVILTAAPAAQTDPMTFVRPIATRDPFVPPPAPPQAGSTTAPAQSPVMPLPADATPGPAPDSTGSTGPPAAVATETQPNGPSNSAMPPPAGVPAPAWELTGILVAGGNRVAILRNGSARRFVHKGDVVDGEYRVVFVGAQEVHLRRHRTTFTLRLGVPDKADSTLNAASAAPTDNSAAAEDTTDILPDWGS